MYNVGFVLSGGGTRGFTHLGILKALDEIGVKPDIISGVSAGAISGAFIAGGYSPEKTMDIILENKLMYYFRPTWKGMGFLNMDKIHSFYNKYFPDNKFEALKIPLIVSATDITHGETIYFSKGNLINPIIASSSIPVIFNPVPYKDMLLLDGGILNNFPIEPLMRKCNKIIGLHCNKMSKPLRSNSKKGVIERAFHLAIYNTIRPKFRRCDVVLEPPDSGDFSMFDIGSARDLFNLGYNYTMAKRKEIEEKIL